MKKLLIIAIVGFLILSCEKSQNIVGSNIIHQEPLLPEIQADYLNPPLPSEFFFGGDVENQFEKDKNFNGNPELTNEGANLGRVLFYDRKLSLNNSIACGSCHLQSRGFSDPVSFSEGFEGKFTKRNSSSIVNPIVSSALFWDSRASNVLNMTLNPVQNHIEMGMEDLVFLEKKLARISYYPDLFKKAYGNTEITKNKIAEALAQFVCSLTTSNSKYDKSLKNNFQTLTQLESTGKNLFFSNKTQCSGCHGGINFSAASSQFNEYSETKGTANIGLDRNNIDIGFGDGSFKIPSLRNVAVSAPYMHDGRFKTLVDVINHYDHGIQNNPNLDKKLKSGNSVVRMNLTEYEKKSLVAFLNTLTDTEFLQAKKFSNPFVY
ncbi:MAG: cytochrome c peroxidase [Saprospiraceae bacterium]